MCMRSIESKIAKDMPSLRQVMCDIIIFPNIRINSIDS